MKKIILALFITFSLKSSFSETFLIIQKENAIVKDSVVLLKNIADIDCNSSKILYELENIVIGETPSIGLSRSFSKYDIIKSLRKNDFDSRDFDFKGANRTFVEPYAFIVSEDEIIKRAKPLIEEHLKLNSNEISIELKTKIPKIALENSYGINFSYQILINRVFTGNIIMNLDILSGNQILKSLKLAFQVKIFKEVYSAKNNISKGSVISKDDIILRLSDVTKEFSEGFLKDENEIIGKLAERDIVAGFIFTGKHLGNKTLIKRKQLIEMVIKSGSLNISARGEALEKGCKGDIIKAKNIDTGVIVYGEITDNNTIRVK